MSVKHLAGVLQYLRVGLTSLALVQLAIGQSLPGSDTFTAGPDHWNTRSPIKHVIVIIGENRSFDHVFATYKPKRGEHVWNLLSQRIIEENGAPGDNFNKARQHAASDIAPDTFLLSPPMSHFPNKVLPAPLTGGPTDSYVPGDSLQLAKESENGLPDSAYPELISGGTGLASHVPDTRITDVNSLPSGPFQLTNGSAFTYNSYAASPVHRFYQMWQQLDCSAEERSCDILHLHATLLKIRNIPKAQRWPTGPAFSCLFF